MKISRFPLLETPFAAHPHLPIAHPATSPRSTRTLGFRDNIGCRKDAPCPLDAHYPTTPPDASKINVGAPSLDGNATVAGSAGAVPGGSSLVVVNLSSGNVITTTAALDGSFSTGLYAPPGSSLLIKYDLVEDRIDQYWQDVQLSTAPDMSYMNPLPGTMIYVSDVTPGSKLKRSRAPAGSAMREIGLVGGWRERSPAPQVQLVYTFNRVTSAIQRFNAPFVPGFQLH